MKAWIIATALVLAVAGLNARAETRAESNELIGHKVVLDAKGKLLAWTPYDRVMHLAWTAFKSIPVQSYGVKPYIVFPRFEGTGEHPFNGIMWAHNPAGLAAMIGDSALSYYAYSGDFDVLGIA